MTPEDQRLWATLVHVGGIFLYFVSPLVGYLVLKERGGFIRGHTATALNFQLTLLIGYVVGAVLTIVLIGILILIAVSIIAIVFSIIAAMEANAGRPYKYPMAIEFVR